MQFGEILGNDNALGIGPRTFANPVARVHGRLAVRRLRAHVSVPGVATGAGTLRQLLAALVRSFEAADVGAVSGARTGDEKRHAGLLRQAVAAQAERKQ
jgi:hypothetical protein